MRLKKRMASAGEGRGGVMRRLEMNGSRGEEGMLVTRERRRSAKMDAFIYLIGELVRLDDIPRLPYSFDLRGAVCERSTEFEDARQRRNVAVD